MAIGIPPYVAYRTFENFLAELKARGIPSRIDRSILAHKSGTVQSQLLLAFTYLDLLTATGRPTEKLRGLVASEGATKKSLQREIIKSSYGFLFKADFDLTSATSHQVEELFKETGASGETVRRCISFFMAAARTAGIPFSPYLKPHKGKKSHPRTLEEPMKKAQPNESATTNSASAARRIHLGSGGSLTLELSCDLFRLNKTDRQFVFEVIDLLNEYPQQPVAEKD